MIGRCPPGPESVYPPPRPSDPAQTHVAGGNWLLAHGTGALPVMPGTALWSPDPMCNRTSRNRRGLLILVQQQPLVPDLSPATPRKQTAPTPQRTAEQTTQPLHLSLF